MEILIAILVFACCLSVAAAFLPQPALQVFMPKTKLSAPRAEQGGLSSTGETAVKRRWMIEIVLWRVGRLFGRLRRQSKELQERPVYPNARMTVVEFNGLKIMAVVMGVLVYSVLAHELATVDPVFLAVAGGVGYVLPFLWLRSRIRRRHQAILRLLPEVTDLLSLCVGAGLDFLGSLNKVVINKANKREPLIEELSIVLQEIRLGKRRIEALRAMAARVNLLEVSSFVRTLVQADKMGTPIGEALVVHAEDVRLQRFMRAERQALQAPIKLLLPLVFIMFSVLILVAAPILLQFVRESPLGR